MLCAFPFCFSLVFSSGFFTALAPEASARLLDVRETTSTGGTKLNFYFFFL